MTVESLKIVLTGETPSKKNSRVVDRRTGRTFPSAAFRKWHDEKVFEALTNCRGGIPQPPLKIRFEFTPGDLRRRDSDNQASSVLDLLVDTKIIPDDGWNVVRNIEIANGYEKGKPSVTVEISAAE